MPPATPAPAVGAPARSATLLVLNPSEEVAKRIESHMRNAGHPVRTVWVTDLEDLEDVVRRSPPDLLLCTDGMPKATPQDVISLCTRVAPDLPVLLMGANRLSPADTVTALAAGARDLVAYSDLRHLHHLEMVCLREIAAHDNLRQLRASRARLADFEARHKKLMAGTGDAVVHIKEGIVTHVNAAFATLLGYGSPDDFEGNPIMDFVRPDQQAEMKQFLKLVAQGKARTDQPLHLQLQAQDGRVLKLAAQVTVGMDQEDRLLELLIHPEAQPAAPAPPGKAGAPAALPPTPSLAAIGRLDLYQALGRIPLKGAGQIGLVFVAVDDFRTVEERLGYHDAGQALAQLAELLRQRLGPKEALFRFSTAELAVVGARPKMTEFEALAETLRKDVAAHLFKTSTHEAHLTVTVAAYPLSEQEPVNQSVESVVRETRKLSLQGGNKSALLGPTAESAQQEMEMLRKAEQVKKALAENRIKLAYQSIASLEGDNHQHFDVLARMLDETGKEVSAKDFIPAAERHGLMTVLDRWVVARALKVLAKREGARDSSSLFVRLSEQTLRDSEAFYKWFREALKARPLKKEELVLQVQETILETHIGKARALCKALKEVNAEIAIDHFGSGTASAQLLEHIPASFVRFHASYTKNFSDANVQKKLADLMDVAKRRQVRTIVGHVEDANVMARLWQLGVNYIQGYHIQEPEAVLLSTDVPR